MASPSSAGRSANGSLSRRRFLGAGVAATTLGWTAPAILRGRNLNEKLNIAVIGSGGRGASNMRSLESENIVAVCDVNETNLEFAARRHPRARKAVDFRKLFPESPIMYRI